MKTRLVYVCSNVEVAYFNYVQKCVRFEGVEVVPVSHIPEFLYREAMKTHGIRRIIMRIRMYLLYTAKLAWQVLFAPKGSIFLVTSNTFYAPLCAEFLSRISKCKVIHVLFDLYPDVLEIADKIRVNGFISRLIGGIIRMTQKRCYGTIYLGDLLMRHAERRWGRSRNSVNIDITTDENLFPESLPSPPQVPLSIHYGGQLSYMHEVESITESIRRVLSNPANDSAHIRFHFNVGGGQAEILSEAMKGFPIEIHGAVRSDIWRKGLSDFHIGLVSLSPGGATVCLPSKTYAMMAGGLAIIAICPVWSDLAELIMKNDIGWVINNSSFESYDDSVDDCFGNYRNKRDLESITQDFTELVSRLIANPSEVIQKRQNAFNTARTALGYRKMSEKWMDYLRPLLSDESFSPS